MSAFRADDRVLLLVSLTPDDIAVLGRVLSRGVLVVIAPREFVDRGRQALADFDNIMFIEAGDGNRVPWRDAYFTKIVVEPDSADNSEIARLLAPGGVVISGRRTSAES